MAGGIGNVVIVSLVDKNQYFFTHAAAKSIQLIRIDDGAAGIARIADIDQFSLRGNGLLHGPEVVFILFIEGYFYPVASDGGSGGQHQVEGGVGGNQVTVFQSSDRADQVEYLGKTCT